MFSVAERSEMLRELTADLRNVRIDTFDGLMVEYAKSIDAMCVLRGIRAISDYEYELQMALMNRKLEPTLETVFMMPADKYSYVSSRLVREVAQAGGPVKGLVPEVVEQKLREKLDPAYKLAGRNSLKSPGEGREKHDHGNVGSAKTHGTDQPHRTFRHDGGRRRGGKAAFAGHRCRRFRRRRAAFFHAATHQGSGHCSHSRRTSPSTRPSQAQPNCATRLRTVITSILIPTTGAKKSSPPSAASMHCSMPFRFW